MSAGFFTQQVPVTVIPARNVWLLDVIDGRDVLHAGCTDWPVYHPNTNLHLHLDRHGNARTLDGLDPHPEPDLQARMSGKFHWHPDTVDRVYDVILIPEVLEHLDDPVNLLVWARSKAPEIVVTAPCWMGFNQQFQFDGRRVTELVHPDHVAWYSPATLRSLAHRAGLTGKLEMLWINEGRMTGLHWRRI